MYEFLHVSTWTMPSLVPVGEDLERLLDSNTIYLNHPENLECLKDLEAEYPQLLTLSYDELESYSLFLFYLSRNVEADKIKSNI